MTRNIDKFADQLQADDPPDEPMDQQPPALIHDEYGVGQVLYLIADNIFNEVQEDTRTRNEHVLDALREGIFFDETMDRTYEPGICCVCQRVFALILSPDDDETPVCPFCAYRYLPDDLDLTDVIINNLAQMGVNIPSNIDRLNEYF